MRKSISVWSFDAGLPLAEKFRLAREAGFAGFEIDLTEAGAVTSLSTAAALRSIRRLADRSGIELSGLATGLYWGANPASANPAVRSKAARILQSQISIASGLGIDAVLVIPGSVGVDFIPGCEVVPYDAAWKRAGAFVQAALPAAKKAGVRLCIENVWNKFLLSPLEMKRFIDQFGSEWVCAYLDIGNTLAFGYPEQWVSILGSAVRRVHLKDYRRNVGSADGFVELFSGDVNWPAVMNALRTSGYSGWLTAEMIPPSPFYKHGPEVLIHNTSRALDALLAM